MQQPLAIVNLLEFNFQDRPGGIGRIAWDLARGQVERGHVSFIVSQRTSDDAPDREVVEGVRLLRVSSDRHASPDPRNFFGPIFNLGGAIRRAKAEIGRIDVLHGHTPRESLAGYLSTFHEHPGPLRVHTIHSPWLMEIRAQNLWRQGGPAKRDQNRIASFMMATRALESACYEGADAVVSHSSFTKRSILEDYGDRLVKKPFGVFPAWVDTQRFTPRGEKTDWTGELGRKPRGPVILTVRGLKPRNGFELLLEAFRMLKAENVDCELVIGGDGAMRGKIVGRIEEYGLGDRVTMLGRVSEERLPVLYRSCGLFVLPTIALECFGLIILEAFASGVPVVATPVAAIPELMNEIYPEGLCEQATALALKDKLKSRVRLLGEGASSEGAKSEFRSKIEGRYSMDIGVSRFMELYEMAAEQRRFMA